MENSFVIDPSEVTVTQCEVLTAEKYITPLGKKYFEMLNMLVTLKKAQQENLL